MYAEAGLAGLQLVSGYFQAQNIRESAKLNREIADMNAQYAELDAYDARTQGYTDQARYQSVIDQTLGEQQLALTAQDIDVSYGTAGTIQKETKFTGELNLMEIQKQAEEKALGYKTQARQYRMGGVIQEAEAKSKAASVMFTSAMSAAKTAAPAIAEGVSGYRNKKVKLK